MKTKKYLMLAACAALLSGCGGQPGKDGGTEADTAKLLEESKGGGKNVAENLPADEDWIEEDGASWEEAESTPYGRYPETVNYTLGKMVNAAYSGLPEGDSYEDNVYIRYLKEKLNIQSEIVMMADGTAYSTMEQAAVTEGGIPDVMVIDDAGILKTMVENDMVEDLTPYFDTCFSDRIKEIYNSYGEDQFAAAEFDGKIYGLPETDIYSGANFVWLRRDWMDKLGLEPPRTLDDVENIVRAFIEEDPGENGEGETIGLLCDTKFNAETGIWYNMAPVFDAFGAYPGIWFPKEDGTIEYGSIQPEMKNAVRKLREWYEEGIIDPQFLLRTAPNNAQLVIDGKCGSFFGWWWAPNNPLENAVRADPDADWQPYLISNDGGSVINTYLPYCSEKYVVVRKGYEHPEIVMKIISTLYDYARYEDKDAAGIRDYFARGVEPTATPLVINCDYSDAIFRVTKNLQDVLSGDEDRSILNTIEEGYYNACQSYLDGKNASSADWAAYTSRISAVGLLTETEIHYVNEGYTQEFQTLVPEDLKEYENECLLKIVMGQRSLREFDQMVDQWYAWGGSQATQEAQKIYEAYNGGDETESE